MDTCPPPDAYVRVFPYNVTGMPRQKIYGPNERTGQAPEKIQVSDKEIARLSDAQFKTLVIRMITEMVELCLQNRGKSEGYEK